jgi:acyl dehydratase
MGLRELVGAEVGPDSWLVVSQEMIDLFADATGDRQWIHVDPSRAGAGPFGGTVAHGFLTLSLCVPLLYAALPIGDYGVTINYGVNRVRFPAPLPAGSRIRARFLVERVDDVPGGEQAVVVATVEREGGEKPVCVAELVLRLLNPVSEVRTDSAPGAHESRA